MADKWAINGVSRDDEPVLSGTETMPAVAPRKVREPAGRSRPALSHVLTIVVGVVGLAALGASAWVYAQTQRDIKRVSTDIAQIRLSLELFGRQQAAGSSEAGSSDSDTSLRDISNRLALLEANQRNPGPAAAAAPSAASGAAATAGVAASAGDCLPTGTRFMVAAGDSYPVCGTTGTVSIAAVDDGYLTLADGTIIAAGGTIPLSGTRCMLGVMPSEGDGLSGFAEIRVAC